MLKCDRNKLFLYVLQIMVADPSEVNSDPTYKKKPRSGSDRQEKKPDPTVTKKKLAPDPTLEKYPDP